MKRIINISEEQFKDIQRIVATQWGGLSLTAEQIIADSTLISKGHWIREKSIHGWDGYSYQCSECGRSIHLDSEVENLNDYPYCHCGAKMENEE